MLFIGQILWLKVDHKKNLCEVLFNVFGSLECDVQQLLMGFSPPPRPLFSCTLTPCCVFLFTYHQNQGPFYINLCPHPDQTMLRLSCPVCTTLATCHWKQGAFIFFPPRGSSHWPRWLSPKDALSLPEGAFILHSLLWWTMQLDWGGSLCVWRWSACVCCHCTVCWNNSWTWMTLRMKRRNLSRFTSRSSSGASAFLLP